MIRQAFAFGVVLAAMAAPAIADEPGSAELAALPPNRWVVFHEDDSLKWRRQGHGGVAYDSQRGTLLLFGSNSHGADWDNTVHEFDPATKQWSTHYRPADPATYRADDAGNRIAGPPDRLLPWAMHTYDSVLYDPRLDALVVTSVSSHTAPKQAVPGGKHDPVWIYDLSKHEWRIFEGDGRRAPAVFASASAYDSRRDTLMVYGGHGSRPSGMFELGPDRKKWHRVADTRHEIHFNMDYDSTTGTLAVFGDYGNSNTVWVYTPHPQPGRNGRWDERVPEGKCPRDQSFPVAFDKQAGVFVLMPRGVTCLYDPAANRYTKLPEAKIRPDAEAQDMNYNMVYDERHGVFLLVTGTWRKPARVWALRLDPAELD